VISFLLLGYLGLKPTNIWGQIGGADVATVVAQLCTLLYFLFFFIASYSFKIGSN
jgi:ubiquinol-cytochrome c reductase cytochrome b subunit